MFTPSEIDMYFGLLEKALKSRLLRSMQGGFRVVAADEFMLMQRSGNVIGFKHCNSRNYVFLNVATAQLDVPVTSQAFQRGHF